MIDDSKEPRGYLKEVQRAFQGGFRDVLRKFQGCLKKVSSVFKENFMKSFLGDSSFVLKLCCSMNLIAATRAEGGLVSLICQLLLDQSL